MIRLTLIAAAMLASAPGIANAADAPCLTAGEFSSLAGYSLPSVISGTTQRCAMTLGPKAFLNRSGKDLASRYAARKDKDWPKAKAAFLKISGTKGGGDVNKMFQNMPDNSLQQVLDAMLEGMVAQQIPLERCDTIDDVIRLLAPLPPENTAELIALAVGLGSKAKAGKVGSINLCPA